MYRLVKKLFIVNLSSGAVTVALALVAFVEAMRKANSNMLIYVSGPCQDAGICHAKYQRSAFAFVRQTA